MNHFSVIDIKRKLLEQRHRIVSLPPEKVVDAILDAPQPHALVHSFPEEDFYFLIHDIGPEDSLPLLRLASSRQWEYLFDVEMWENDRISLPGVTRWLALIQQADPQRLVRWAVEQKLDFIEYYLFKNIVVTIREHDQDPSDFGQDAYSNDDIYYYKFVDSAETAEGPDNYQEKRETVITTFLEKLAEEDYLKYQQVLMDLAGIIPAEVEEEEFRLRNVRLAEKGFLPFDEAIGVYQPLKKEALRHRPHKFIAPEFDEETFLPVPLYPSGMLEDDNRFTQTLQTIDHRDILMQILTEFATLSNRVIAADRQPIRYKDDLKRVVQKVCGYVSIGLTEISDQSGDAPSGARILMEYPLSDIFKVGYGLALELKWAAERWRKTAWFEQNGFPLSFWGEKWLGVLGGLLVKKPLYFDNYQKGVIYREFETPEDIETTRRLLDEIITFDGLLSCLPVSLSPLKGSYFNYKAVVLTLWARDDLGMDILFKPIPLDRFRSFFKKLWSLEGVIRKEMKTSFLRWIADFSGIDEYDLSRKLGPTFEEIFQEIEEEYKAVAPEYLDPRFIYHFWIENPERENNL